MIGLLVVCLFLACPLWAADYFVSSTGNDANSGGSPESPWQTLKRINRVTFAAGDRIFLEGGHTFDGGLQFDADDRGSGAAPITVASYGTGRATIRAGAGTGVSLYNTSGFVIRNLNIVGGWSAVSQSGNTDNGIDAYNDLNGSVKLTYIRIDNVEISGFRNAGIAIGGYPADGGKSGFRDVRITNSLVHDNGDVGIISWGYFKTDATGYANENIHVSYCRTYNNRGVVNRGQHSGSGIILGDVDGGVIERCVSYNNGDLNNHTSGGPVGIWAWDANNVTIQNNESYANKSATLDGGGFDLDGGVTNSVMQYNYSHDNFGAGFLFAQFPGARPFHNNVARYNISQNDDRKTGQAGIYFWNAGSGLRDCQVYNNTVFLSPSSLNPMPRALRLESGLTDIRLYNNIFMTTGGLPLVDIAGSQTNLVLRNNNYWSSGDEFVVRWDGVVYNSFADWQAATGQERSGGVNVGWNVDPLFRAPGTGTAINNPHLLPALSAYRIQNYSPLSNAGNDLLLEGLNPGGRDYSGTATPTGGAFDIGAVETTNYLRNTGFETGNDAGWLQWWDTGLTPFSSAYVDNGAVHSGHFRLGHWAATAYRQYTYQTVSDLPNGSYTLKVRLFSSGGQRWAGVGVKGYDAANPAAERFVQTTGDADFQEYTISDIVVSSNQCTVWLWSDAGANQWLLADDFELTPSIQENVASNGASFVSASVPSTMVAGHRYPVSLTLRNSGTSTWYPAGRSAHRLGSQHGQDNTTWGLNRVLLPHPVAPDQEHTFTFIVTAPSASGTHPLQWRMVQDYVEWFGDYTPPVMVQVEGRHNQAQFVSQSVPATMEAGKSYTVAVTIRNTGNTTWTSDALYRLGSQHAQDNTTWGLNRVLLSSGVSVSAGQEHTFSFTVTAPSASGTYPFQWRMVQDYVEWFGDYTPGVNVTVNAPAPL